MPRLFAPHKSSLHRQTCLALYRALLRESSRAGTATESTSLTKTLRSLIRYRFQRDRTILSPSKVASGMEAGHGHLTLLRACTAKSPTDIAELTRVLEQVSLQAESTAKYREHLASKWKPPPPSRIPHLEFLRSIASKKNQAASTPSQPRIFEHPRPLSEVKSGVRKVPNLIVAQGIPLLKYPGPVPLIVNRVLNEKVDWGVRKWEQHKEMEVKIQIAEWEDDWDEALAEVAGLNEEDEHAVGENANGRPSARSTDGRVPNTKIRFHDPTRRPLSKSALSRVSWATHIAKVDQEITNSVYKRGKRYGQLGDRYWHEVVVKERDLKEQERKEKKHERRMARKQDNAESISKEWDPAHNSELLSSVASGYV